MIILGSKVRDNITGFTGTATGRTEYMFGCARVMIETSEMKDGKPVDALWFDEQRVEIVKEEKPIVSESSSALSGGPQNGYSRSIKLTADMFKKCLMSLSADRTYLDWLVGRNVGERDRSPCYSRMKQIFAKRIHEETGKREKLPQPEWAH